MSDETMEQMGREVVAATGWVPGMRAKLRGLSRLPISPRLYEAIDRDWLRVGAVRPGSDGDELLGWDPAGASWSTADWWWPDLTDSATLGCVMGWLRERKVWIRMDIDGCMTRDPRTHRWSMTRPLPEALHAAVLAVAERDA